MYKYCVIFYTLTTVLKVAIEKQYTYKFNFDYAYLMSLLKFI